MKPYTCNKRVISLWNYCKLALLLNRQMICRKQRRENCTVDFFLLQNIFSVKWKGWNRLSLAAMPQGGDDRMQKVLIHIEHHSVCPFVGIGPHPTLLPLASVCPPPRPRGGGVHSPADKGVEESQFRRLEKSLALCLLCDRMPRIIFKR